MDSAGCQLNCNLALAAAPARAKKGARWAASARYDLANRKCRHVDPAAGRPPVLMAGNGAAARHCRSHDCPAADMDCQPPVAEIAAGPPLAPLADCGVAARRCHSRGCPVAGMDCQRPVAQPAECVADCPASRMAADCRRSVGDSPSMSGHRDRVARRAEPSRSFHGWQSGESARGSLR